MSVHRCAAGCGRCCAPSDAPTRVDHIRMCAVQLSFIGPVLACQWDISSGVQSFLTTAVFIGMSG